MQQQKRENEQVDVAIAYGDGVGPEIMAVVREVLDACKTGIVFHEIEVGEKAYLRGNPTGIEPQSWEVLRNVRSFLKAPITTPQGGGFRSLNVTIRSALGLYANVRPCVAYHPCVDTRYPGMNVTIVRENEEDLYAGIEYRHTSDTYHALKVMTREGSEKIIRYAFEYAKANGKKKVTCFTKDNILKLSDGIFHKSFIAIAKEYPEITPEHWIIDIGSAKMADAPENFEVIVTCNLYGDIVSDIAAQIAGSVGLAGSANIGKKFAMFEAIHGSAPRRAGQNLANPSGLLLAAVMMLVHLGKLQAAETIHNAWLKTLEDGIHTYDIFDEKRSKEKVGTKEFGKNILKRLGQVPSILQPARYVQEKQGMPFIKERALAEKEAPKKKLVGVDFFCEERRPIQELVTKLEHIDPLFQLEMITSRGATLWPSEHPPLDVSEHLRLRFMAKGEISPLRVHQLEKKLLDAELELTLSVFLFSYDDIPGFSLAPEKQ